MNRFTSFLIAICASQTLLATPRAVKCELHFNSSMALWYTSQLPGLNPQPVKVNTKRTYDHPLANQIRELSEKAIKDNRPDQAVVNDFKPLSDMIPKNISPDEEAKIYKTAKDLEASHGKQASLSYLLKELFSEPGTELGSAPETLSRPRVSLQELNTSSQVVNYIEELWSDLIKVSPLESEGSLIPLPYPSLVPGDRFQESYYWDTFFTIKALIATGRLELAAMQVENFLYLISHYGLVPNGARTYYLSRSQPPLLASMIKLVSEEYIKNGHEDETKDWLKEKALPLVKGDYQDFWMNPDTRYDKKTGLNHHWDSETSSRPERHGADNDSEIGINPQHTRAGAEFAKDFTDTVEGEYGHTAGILLNSVLFKLETDMSELYRLIDDKQNSSYFLDQSVKRNKAIDTYLWNAGDQTYYDYNLRTEKPFKYVIADAYIPLWAEVASPLQAAAMVLRLPLLERDGGLMSSNLYSGRQWDAPFMWAPLMYFVVEGLINYGYLGVAKRLARKYITTVNNTFEELGYLIEKMDAVTSGVPIEDGEKYETQRGFLWTNGVYLHFLTHVMNAPLTFYSSSNKK